MKITHSMFAAALFIAPASLFAGVTVNSNGWTQVTPSSDSRIVYVSNAGNDSNDGLSPGTPKATIAAADALIRDGYPDHLLLRRGDTFTISGTSGLYRWKNGRSATEPILLSYYGSSGARPVIKIAGFLVNHDGQVRNHQAFIGLDVYKSVSDPGSSDFNNTSGDVGARLIGGGANILIEDCRFRFSGLVVQSYPSSVNIYTNVKIRRNIVLDAWIHNSFTDGNARTQGLFMDGVNGYVVEENFFDHNGWSETVANAGANQYNHNVYIQYSNRAGGIIRGNIVARGSAHGIQARAGGVAERNLFVLNAVGMNMGGNASPTDPNVFSFANTMAQNVVLNGRTMHPTNNSAPRTPAVYGLDAVVSLIPNIVATDNIVANRIGNGSNTSYFNVNMANNISYNWTPSLDTTNSSWPHPADDLGDFYASIGGANSTTAYLDYLRGRAIGSLPWNMTAYAAINYIRAGFNRPAVAGYYSYPGSTPVVTIAATDASAGEPSNHGQFTVTANPAPSSPITVNLTRTGTAQNGVDYSSIGTSVNVGTSGSANIAVNVLDDTAVESSETVILTLASGSGYTIGSPNSATVTITDNDTGGGLPSPWLTQDVGAVAATGTAAYSSGTFTIEGSGYDIFGSGDEFRYVYQQASGDCVITARVTSLEQTHSWAKAGVMIRESLTTGSRHAAVLVAPSDSGTVQFLRRVTASQTTLLSQQSNQGTTRWLRVTRSGNTITAEHSSNGTSWTTISSATVTMSSNVYIGLAVTSHNDGTLCTATFTNVSVTP